MKIRFLIKWILLLSLLFGCGGGTTTGNPYRVTINFKAYNSVTSWSPWDLFIDKANAGINNLTFCFKRVRFKLVDGATVNPDSSEDNIDFDIGEITILSGGTTLGDINVPEGTYKRVEFDLEKDCSSNKSVTLSNDNGNFSTDNRVTIKFSGTLVINETTTINLDIQPIINAMDSFNGSSDLDDVLEDINGTL